MRLRSNRCLYAAPPAYSGRGRPRLHGEKFKLNHQATWWADDESVELKDTALGRLRRRQWQNLHQAGERNSPHDTDTIGTKRRSQQCSSS